MDSADDVDDAQEEMKEYMEDARKDMKDETAP